MSDDEFDALTAELASRGVAETVGHGYTVDSNKISTHRQDGVSPEVT